MLITRLCIVISAYVSVTGAYGGDDFGDEDRWPENGWVPESGNEIGPVVDVDHLGERLRKSVHLLKGNKKLELVFLIDASSSIGEENFNSELRFIQKLVADFNVGPNNARVAVIGFASDARIHVNHLEDIGRDKCTFLHNELPSLEYTGGNTNTIAALVSARGIFATSRTDADKALFLVTDGFSNKGDPVPVASELKAEGITIFTFGIQTGNVREVRQIASTPSEDYSFVLESFHEFEALARRALHEDLKSGSYVVLNDTSLCNGLCSNPSPGTGCCNNQSKCSCGILTGHFACLCPPGFYGTGFLQEECQPCPTGTYHDGSEPGDVLVCTPCPDVNHRTAAPGARSESECICKDGYMPVDGKCEVATCPTPTVPTNGYFVNKNCSNVVNAACGVRCSTGYKLHGSSIRICQGNGTWSGHPPTCSPKSCKRPKPVRDSVVTCKNDDSGLELHSAYDSRGNVVRSQIVRMMKADVETREAEEFNYTVDTMCAFKCSPGYNMIGSRMRMCLPILQWNGLAVSCTVLSCSPLPLLKDGLVKPDNCTEKGLRHSFATECWVACRDGYRLEGPALRNCTGRRGTWTGKNVPNKCIDIEPPVFTCPENITVEAKEQESYALVHLSLPSGTDNSGAEPIIWSKPPFLPEYPLPLKIGITRIEIFGTDGSDNGESCDFYVNVQDNEAPQIYNCESPSTFYLSDLGAAHRAVNWTEPVFMDNSETPLKIEKSHDFGTFPIGTTSVVYVVTDASGNSANCTINITLSENPCTDRPDLGNVEWNCTTEENLMTCKLSCPDGLTWTTNADQSDVTFMCQHDGSGARWSPDIFSDLDSVPECSVFELPTEVVESHEFDLDSKDVSCDDLDKLSEEISSEINVLLGADADAANVSIFADCIALDDDDNGQGVKNETSIAEDPPSNDISRRRRKRSSTGRKRVRVHVSIVEKATNKTSTEEVARRLNDLGEKVEREYAKNPYIAVGGKKVKIQQAKKTDSARLRCNSGFVLKRGLCVKCPSGTFYNPSKSNCTPCPVGQYQSLEGQSQCEACPAGHLTRRRRRKQLKDCKKICPPGTFGKIKNKQGKTALVPCTPCPVGSYQSAEGQTECLKCPEDKTTAKRGSSNLGQCVEPLTLQDPCYKFPCKNNGTCFLYNGFPSCHCPEGFLGSFCERERNHCDSSPCYNNGECTPVGVTGFLCTCPRGFEGDLCQFDVDECASQPCLNGAECVDLHDGYKCECSPGFTGTICEEDIDECELFNYPCLNNGQCNNLVNGYNCTCLPGFSGKHCEEVSECAEDDVVDRHCRVKAVKARVETDPCSGLTCPTNMECVITPSNNYLPHCACRKGFYGKNCDEEINFDVMLTFPKRSVTMYMTADFPTDAIHQISVCMWIQTSDTFNYGTLFSYAVKNEDNTFTITDYKGFVLYVQRERVVTDIVANDGHWHFVCVTWESRDGSWEIYLDGKRRGNGTGLSAGSPIPGGGRFIIGQEQDRFGGGFNEVESFVGKMAHLDIWKKVITQSEVEEMNEKCKYFEGDLFRWLQFLENIHGHVEISPSTFCTNCNARELGVHKGRVTIQSVRDSIFGVYECDTGFRVHFDEDDDDDVVKNATVWYRKCLKHGNWDPKVPKCIRVNCGFPGYFPHGTVEGTSYLFSDTIEYRCNHGYSLVGESTRMCLENGSWSGEQPTCKGNTGLCEEILAPRHGSMFIYFGGRRKQYSTAIGDRAEFVCDEGYLLRGSDTLTCTDEGIWNEEVPTCEEISCRFPNEIREVVADTTFVTAFTAGESLRVKCNELDDVKKIVCQPDGSWNYTLGLCGRKCEGKPNYPEHGLLIGDPLRYVYDAEERIYAKCRYGYRLVGDDYFTCTANGTWHQNRKTTCQSIECVKLIPPPNTYTSSIFTTYPYGRRISFRCLPGFKQIGDLQTRCDGEGRWTRIYGRCVETRCSMPVELSDVIITEALYTHGDKLDFKCLNGATPTSTNIVCQEDGAWSCIARCL